MRGMAKRNIGVGIGILVFRDDKILLGDRKNKKHLGWAPPGGHLEEGESFEECAARELREEIGMRAEKFKVAGVTNDLFPSGDHYVTIYLKAGNFSGELKNREPHYQGDWTWFSFNALPKPLFMPFENLLKQKTLKELSD